MKHVLLVCGWLLAPLAHADEAAFQFSRGITAPELSQVELLAVPLDTAVFSATEPGYPDVRILGGDGEPAPFIVRKAETTRTRTERSTWSARKPEARPVDGGLEIIVQLEEKDPQPQGLTIISPLKDFEQRVRVYSSVDGGQWEPLGEETLIFDYSRFINVRNDQVTLGETINRRFRIVIDDVTTEQESELLALTKSLRGGQETGREERVTIARRPFHIERIDFWRDVERSQVSGEKKAVYPLANFRVTEDAAKKQTIITVDSEREPLTSLELETAEANFSRSASVEVEEKHGVQTSWQPIGSNTLSRIAFKDLKQELLSIHFSESRQDSYRVVIDNRDNPPLKFTGVIAEGNVYELLFLASPGKSYRLAYGSSDVTAPQYDTAAIQQVLAKGFKPTQAALGVAELGVVLPAAFRWSDLLNSRRLQLIVVVLLVAALGWSLYHAMKRVDSLPNE